MEIKVISIVVPVHPTGSKVLTNCPSLMVYTFTVPSYQNCKFLNFNVKTNISKLIPDTKENC